MVSSAAAAMVVTVMDSTVWYRPGDGGLNGASRGDDRAGAVVAEESQSEAQWKGARQLLPNVPGARAWLGVAGSCGTHRSGEWGRLRFHLARASKLFALVVLVVRGPGARSACRQSR